METNELEKKSTVKLPYWLNKSKEELTEEEKKMVDKLEAQIHLIGKKHENNELIKAHSSKTCCIIF